MDLDWLGLIRHYPVHWNETGRCLLWCSVCKSFLVEDAFWRVSKPCCLLSASGLSLNGLLLCVTLKL